MPARELLSSVDCRVDEVTRIIVDTNVVSNVLRWMAFGKSSPSAADIDDLRLIQQWVGRIALRAKVQREPYRGHVDIGLAGLEASRHLGKIDGARFAQLVAANELLRSWLLPGKPRIGPALFCERPELVPELDYARQADGAPEYLDNARIAYALVLLQEIWLERKSGRLRSATAAFEALRRWEHSLRRYGAVAPSLLIIGVQVALGEADGIGAAVCKFSAYRDGDSALRTAWNAAWDLSFLRSLQASEFGAWPYKGRPARAVLISRDVQLIAFGNQLMATAGLDHASGRRVVGSAINLSAYVRSEVRSEPVFMTRFQRWSESVAQAQDERLRFWRHPPTDDEMQGLLEEELERRYS